MTQHTLTVRTDVFDQTATFPVSFSSRRGERRITAYLSDGGDGTLYIMKKSACIKDQYSAEDLAELNRLRAAAHVRHGDEIVVAGQHYTAHINGDYLDAGYLVPVAN